jgi:hypothetical protein
MSLLPGFTKELKRKKMGAFRAHLQKNMQAKSENDAFRFFAFYLD